MKLLRIIDTHYVPIDKIDSIAIDNADRRKLVIHTVGDMTITNHYPSEEQCLMEFNDIVQSLKTIQL